MNDIPDDSLVLDKCKLISDILCSRYKASGQGLGQLTNSITHKLPISLVLALRRLAEIRNKVIKDRTGFPVSVYRDKVDRDYFERLASEIVSSLENDLQKPLSLLSSQLYFNIINKMSGKALDLALSVEEGGIIHQWEFHGGDNQAWKLNRTNNGFFSVISKASNKCLEIIGGSYDEGTAVQQWSYFGAEHQQWKFVEQTDGSYEIIARHSGKCLDAHYPSIYEDGARIVQWDWWSGDNQKWWLKPVVT